MYGLITIENKHVGRQGAQGEEEEEGEGTLQRPLEE